MKNISSTLEQTFQQKNNPHETLPDQNPEKLSQRIKVFRTMSSTELSKFLNGEQMYPIVDKSKEDLQEITTAKTSAIWFTPDRAEYIVDPDNGNDLLVSDDLEKLDFDGVRKIWNLHRGGINDPSTNNLMVEFLTDKKPTIAYGNYGDYWVKEYTYSEYDKNDFQIQRIYKLSQKEVIFDRMLCRSYESAEEALKEVAHDELEEEQWMEQRTFTGMSLIKNHISELPSPYQK